MDITHDDCGERLCTSPHGDGWRAYLYYNNGEDLSISMGIPMVLSTESHYLYHRPDVTEEELEEKAVYNGAGVFHIPFFELFQEELEDGSSPLNEEIEEYPERAAELSSKFRACAEAIDALAKSFISEKETT